MTILSINSIPDRVLKQKSLLVKSVDDKVRQLMDDMVETMYAEGGIGLAANQVGILKRVIVLNVGQTEDDESELLQMANPEIIERSPELREHEEGCLSIPDQRATVERPDKITVRYLDRKNRFCTLQAKGLLSTCLQHEIDHLNGVLFVDHLSAVKRGMMLRKARKIASKQEKKLALVA